MKIQNEHVLFDAPLQGLVFGGGSFQHVSQRGIKCFRRVHRHEIRQVSPGDDGRQNRVLLLIGLINDSGTVRLKLKKVSITRLLPQVSP
jgi:hypothetical protein